MLGVFQEKAHILKSIELCNDWFLLMVLVDSI